MITIRIPVPRGLPANLAGLLGLVAVAVAVGGLTHNVWWSVLLGGLITTAVAVVATLNAPAVVPVADATPLRPAAARAG